MDVKPNNRLIVFDSVSKKYWHLFALNQVSFEIQQGEIFGYIGPNGAGKTTTIKILVGLLKDFTGKCTIAGYDMPGCFSSVQPLIGYLPQDVSFQEWRTVDQALKTFGRLSGLKEDALEDRIARMLELFELSEVRNKKIQKLSGGMVQKVGLAQALLHRPKLLILDEPLSGLDPASRFTVKAALKELSQNGTTVFFSSHILSDVQDVATRIGILNKGRLLKMGSLDDLKADFFPTQEIEISFSQLVEGWQSLASLTGVEKMKQKSADQLIVSVAKGANLDEISDQLLKQLMALGCRIRSFKPLVPNLDEVYLKYIAEGR